MSNTRVELRRVCIYHKTLLFLFLINLSINQCQIIRKSVELPVKDYLSPSRTGRDNNNGKDPLYVLGGNLDTVRSFEVLSPHTPASALMFAGLLSDNSHVSTLHSTALPLRPTVQIRGRSGENKSPNLFLPISSTNVKHSSTSKDGPKGNNLFPRTSSPSTRQLENEINKVRPGYSFSYSTPDYPDVRGSHAAGQDFIPIYSTPFPSLYQSNDAAIGYFSKFSSPFPPASEDLEGRLNGGYNIYATPMPLQYNTPSYEETINPYPSPTPQYRNSNHSPAHGQPKESGGYYQESKESLDYYSPTNREKIPSSSQDTKGSDEYYTKSRETQYHDNPSENEESSSGSRDESRSEEYYKEPKDSREYYDSSTREDPPTEQPPLDEKPPSVPPTIGVIGWKSNTDHHTSWKPEKALMDMTNQHIKEDLKKDGYKRVTTTLAPVESQGGNVSKYENEEKGKEELNGGEEEEEEESEEEEEEDDSEEEEEEGDESQEDNDHQDDRKELPLEPPPRYENSDESLGSPEYNSEYQNENGPYRSGEYYYDGQTLPPGPPYFPPSYDEDSRTRYGYLPTPLGVSPEEGFQQTWTPIITSENYRNVERNKDNPKYESEKGRGSILGNRFLGEGDFNFENWDAFGKERRKVVDSSQKNLKPESESVGFYDEKRIKKPTKGGFEGVKEVASKDLPVEHRHNRDSREDIPKPRESSEASNREETDFSHRSPAPPKDLDEERERNRVSDHEFPRKVPTRLRYPGGGLWAKPQPESGIDLGFVPKKTYTQTRKYNTVRHLPREAALAEASTAEEMINAPRLKEVVSHKKIQEVYEEEGYEDTGYDHGGYKKQRESKADYDKHNSEEDTAPEKIYEPSEDEVFEEHVAHLEAVPEDDPSGQGSAKKLVQASEKPKVKGSWKQQKTTTDEKSMAFLDEQGKGGILTQKRPTKTEGVVGKYLDVNGQRVPVFREITNDPDKLLGNEGAVSFQRVVPVAHKNVNPEEKVVYRGVSYGDLNPVAIGGNARLRNNGQQGEPKEYYDQDQIKEQINFDSTLSGHSHRSSPHLVDFPTFNSDLIQSSKSPNKLDKKRMRMPQLSSYTSRNNRFSYTHPNSEQLSINNYNQNGYNEDNKNSKNYYKKPSNLNQSPVGNHETVSLKSDDEVPTQSNHKPKSPKINFEDEYFVGHITPFLLALKKGEKPLTLPERSSLDDSNVKSTTYNSLMTRKYPKYSSKFSTLRTEEQRSLPPHDTLDGPGYLQDSEYEVEPTGAAIRERKSRDLTAFGNDGTGSENDFTHPTATLREIEDKISLIASESFDRPPRTRQVSRPSDTASGRKYKEIVRNPITSSEEATETRRDKVLKLREDVLNIRHPFLPRDGSGDVQIDYVQTRTRVQPSSSSSRRRHHYREEVESTTVTEEPTTTTTPRVTTIKSQTTTEYVPEDPSQTLNRLRSNLFLASIFPVQENQEDKTGYNSEPMSTTTPKITTYRAKTTTEDVEVKETQEEVLERLKSNPFLSAIFLSTTSTEEPKEHKQLRSSSRNRAVIVVPDNSDTETDSSVKHVEQLTLAHYSGPSNSLMYKQVPMMTQQRISKLAKHLNSEGVEPMHIIVRRHAEPQNEEEMKNGRDVGAMMNTRVDGDKYPFYYSPESVKISKYSPLRYTTNPKDIPRKTEGGMEFYESRDRAVECEEPTPPKDIVPKRQKDGEWNKSPQPKKQRMGRLGDQIDCLKAKYFGEDPLDNPFFKESVVGVPNLTTQSPDDRYGFYSDIVHNIKQTPERDNDYGRVNHKRQVKFDIYDISDSPDQQKILNIPKKEVLITQNDRSMQHDSSSDSQHELIRLDKEVEESRLTKNFVSPKNKSKSFEEISNQTVQVGPKHPREFDTAVDITTSVPPTFEVKGTAGPIRLHPPKNVIISLRSKGTSNHPKIRLVKAATSPFNINIKVVPLSTLGYLKSNHPLHINDPTTKAVDPSNEKTERKVQPVFKLDSISSAASKITKKKNHPTTVAYLTVDTEGKLLHQHFRTFVPVKSQIPKSEKEIPVNNASQGNKSPTWWDLPAFDERRNEPKYRVKRNHDNDKYINSKESLELKNYLFHKYAEALANERNNHPSVEKPSTTETSRIENKIKTTTSRYVGGFVNRREPLYSSRYSAVDPMEESPTSDIETGSEMRESKSDESGGVRFPPRKPKLRFPKLTMTTRTLSDPERTKLLSSPDTTPVRTSTTTTTTTTEPPPSTTTRMYKPRIVYKKEFGKPLVKVVDMFAVLKRQPPINTERAVPSSTENMLTTESVIRRFKPKRLQQFEHRRVTKEEVIRRTYSPQDEIKERSDKVEVYDSVYDHPDLRGPVSRISRDTPPEDYHEMLVYMVNPRTGNGEWKFMPVSSRSISRMDKEVQEFLGNSNSKKSRRKNKRIHMNPNTDYSEQGRQPIVESFIERTTMSDTEEDEYTTTVPKKFSGKSRRKLDGKRLRNKAYLSSSQLRGTTPSSEEMTSEFSPLHQTPQYINTPNTVQQGTTPEYTTLQHTTDDDRAPTTTLNPKIIFEPYKRKYFYAKI